MPSRLTRRSPVTPERTAFRGCGTLDAMHAQAVADAFGLGRVKSLTDPVARGELGEIRRLESDHGIFAVKQALARGSVADAETSAAYQRACWEAGIPTPEPLRTTSGRFTAQVAGEQVRL